MNQLVHRSSINSKILHSEKKKSVIIIQFISIHDFFARQKLIYCLVPHPNFCWKMFTILSPMFVYFFSSSPGIFVPSYHVELFKTIQPKKFSLCLREIESGSSTSSSLAETEDQRSFLQFKANRRKDNMKAGVRPVSGR